MNLHGLKAIYFHEMDRMRRTLFQSLVSPFISTSLYFVVFGSAIGSRITEIEGISYGSFIVPGMIMLTILTQSISNASFGIFFPKFTNTATYIHRILSYLVFAVVIIHFLVIILYKIKGIHLTKPMMTGRNEFIKHKITRKDNNTYFKSAFGILIMIGLIFIGQLIPFIVLN